MRRLLSGGLAALVLASAFAAAPARQAAADDVKQMMREGRALTRICQTCHHFKREKRKFGPHLVGLIGRPVASADVYEYSDALKALGGVWTEDRLAEFLIDPAAYAPGLEMKFKGYGDPQKARAAAAYIVQRYNK